MGKRTSKPKSPRVETLEALKDVLDLTLTRVIEDDMKVEEARELLAHLEKEVEAVERGLRRAKKKATGKSKNSRRAARG